MNSNHTNKNFKFYEKYLKNKKTLGKFTNFNKTRNGTGQ
tara:strand:- start:34 stop:150 length:117 start_codon:yes stop_codon:yes gene_type:complete